jgi:hypothetical protein
MSDGQVYDDCGTYAAYQRHVKEDTEIDEACRERRDAAARGRALTRLAREHPDEYSRLLEDERAKASS